jgi:molybdenum cofactor biosynthesis protein B
MTDEHTDHDGHHAHDVGTVEFGVLTVSSSRTLETDESGDALVEALESAGHTVSARDLCEDDERAIRQTVETMVARKDVAAVVTTGGTGLSPADVTKEAIEPLFEREIPGFGEQFRAQSVAEVGPHGMLTRATAGIAEGVPVFCLPGSEQAASFGVSELILPVASHVVGLVTGGHDGQHEDETTGSHTHE